MFYNSNERLEFKFADKHQILHSSHFALEIIFFIVCCGCYCSNSLIDVVQEKQEITRESTPR